MTTSQEALVAPNCCEEMPPKLAELGLEMVLIPAGEFLMGTDPEDHDETSALEGPAAAQRHLRLRESPQHTVELEAYLIGKHPITIGQYQAFMAATGHSPPYAMPQADDPQATYRPICFVSWQDANAFCRWLSSETGEAFRLPTEAEWERAARGTDGRTYPWGEAPLRAEYQSPSMFCPTDPCGQEQTIPIWRCNCAGAVGEPTDVRAYPDAASPCGCLDMAGNVWEWCADWFNPEYYRDAPRENPTGPPRGMNRVIRGGAYDSGPDTVRCAARFYDRADGPPFFPCGFRVAKAVPTSLSEEP